LDFVLNNITAWLDFIWIPLVFVFAAKRHWVTAILLILMSIFTLRLQVELMQEIGYATGILPFWDWPVLYRGYIVYGVFIFTFLFLSFFSKRENAYVYIAAAIGIYVLSFCLSTALMLI